jgi:hypothetical protein
MRISGQLSRSALVPGNRSCMPQEHSARTGRTRGSWTPRLAGLTAVLLIAAGGVTAYVVAGPASAARHVTPLPTRVASVQTVGLVATAAGGHAPQQLVSDAGGLEFTPVRRADLEQGSPQWTADTMAGGTYVFIYVPDGRCLAARVRRHRAELVLARCDLGRSQRWARATTASPAGRHQYSEYRNLASVRCLAAGGTPPAGDVLSASAAAATLAPCDPSAPASQLISFWWSA